MANEQTVSDPTPNPMDDVLAPAVLEEVRSRAAALGQDYRITLSVSEVAFQSGAKGAAEFQGQSALRAEYTAADGTPLREPIETSMPMEQAARMLTGYRDAFAQAANPVLSSMPQSVQNFAADHASSVQVTGAGKLVLTMDDVTGDPLRATAETSLRSEGVGTASSFLTVNVGRISELAQARGIQGYDSGNIMNSVVSGDFSFYNPQMHALVDDTQIGINIGINQPGVAPIAAQAYMADPAAMQNPATMLQNSMIYADASFTPVEGGSQTVARMAGDIVATNASGWEGKLIGDSLAYIIGDKPTGTVTAIINDPSVSPTGDFRAEQGSLTMNFNNLNTQVMGMDTAPIIQGLTQPRLEGAMSRFVDKPSVSMQLSAAP